MTKKNTADLIAGASTNFPDNTTGAIKASNHRGQHGDNADSLLNHLDLTNAASFNGQGLRCNTATGLVEPGGTIVANWTATQTTTYQAVAGEAVIVDASGGDFTVTAPATPSEGDIFAIKHIGSGIVTADSGTAGSIESQFPSLGAGLTSLTFGLGNYAAWQYNATDDVWLIVASAKSGAWSEVWSATAQAPMSGTPTPIVWTFQPLFTGQPNLIATHAAGTFTFLVDGEFKVSVVDSMVTFQLIANNSDTEYAIDPVFSGAGLEVAPQFADAFAHARVGSFDRTFAGEGVVSTAANDTLRWDASSSGGAGSITDLTRMNLILSIG